MPNATFASVAEDAPALLWRGDAEGRCVYLNRAQRVFWGVADDGVEHFTWGSTLLPEDADKVYGPFSEGMAQQKAFRCEGRYRRADGEIRILETIAQPRFEDGAFVGMVGVNTDITDQRAAQARLEASEARHRLLVDEMSHRVKNILATVLSIANLTGRSSTSLEDFTETFGARVVALARTHDLMTGQGWEFADLHAVLEAELGPYGGAGRRRMNLTGDPVQLDASSAVSLALVIHELATNAAKYGAYAADGALDVRWTVEPGPRVILDWVETGGPAVTAPTRTGFGSRLITSLLKGELAGDFEADYRNAGLVARLRFRPVKTSTTL